MARRFELLKSKNNAVVLVRAKIKGGHVEAELTFVDDRVFEQTLVLEDGQGFAIMVEIPGKVRGKSHFDIYFGDGFKICPQEMPAV